jgi:DNA adenine methylase
MNKAQRFLISDCLKPLAELWVLLLQDPHRLAREYEEIWRSQLGDPKATYNRIRDEFNQDQQPSKLLYLLARCVKNAVRFNSEGKFNQSPDNRRLGMRPAKMRGEILRAHHLLAGRTVVLSEDYRDVLRLVEPEDLVYMDPPYQGVSGNKDRRYVKPLDVQVFIEELERLNKKSISFMISFDGRCGMRTYGRELPSHLKLKRILLPAGRSSQATLLGRDDVTVESLYLSPALLDRLEHEERPAPEHSQACLFNV